MNERQREAVFYTEGPLLILAGAGSGKTTVLVNRIANLIRYGGAYHSDEDRFLTEQDALAMQAYLDGTASLPEETRSHMAVHACRPWQVLAITFTNKAAGELKNRLSSMAWGAGGRNLGLYLPFRLRPFPPSVWGSPRLYQPFYHL